MVFPVGLTLDRLPVALIGRGRGLRKRLAQLINEAPHLSVYCDDADDEVKALAGSNFHPHLPTQEALANYRVVMIVDLPDEHAAELASLARKSGAIVNVEDVPEQCDFYFMSRVKRGDLQLAISTNGKSPGLSVALREYLEARMDEQWEQRLDELAELRQQWRAEGKAMPEVLRLTKAHIAKQQWLPHVVHEQSEATAMSEAAS